MSETERLRLLIAYDGRPFRGWQSQVTGDAVQDHIERAFAKLVGAPVRIHGAGRTDAGVHAQGQVAHATVPPGVLPIIRWGLALNAHLPPEIRILRVTPARPSFHAQWDARGKIYTYRIWNSPYFHPLEIGRAWHVFAPLDPEVLRTGAQLFIGEHDFAGFAGNRRQPEKDTRRTIREVTVRGKGPLIVLRFRGDGFLYHMIRLLTGSLVRCAGGGAELPWLRDLLARTTGEKTRYLAPAHGLYLTKVLY